MEILSRSETSRLIVILLTIALVEASPEGGVIKEYEVKAAFLYNFAKFVEWPREAFEGTTGKIEICVLGRNPFGSALLDAVRGKSIGSRDFAVREIAAAQEAAGCHILFVSDSERRQLGSVLKAIKSRYVLTVGESDEFLANGGLINFVLRDSNVRFQANTEAISRAKIQISSKLLRIAVVAKQRGFQ